MKMDSEIKEFLDGVVGVCEATHCERSYIWQAWHGRTDWKENLLGHGRTVGVLADMPVCISLTTAQVNGQKILFWYATSQVVDYRMIDAWLLKALPKSAFREGDPRKGVNRTDATNFHIIVPDKVAA